MGRGAGRNIGRPSGPESFQLKPMSTRFIDDLNDARLPRQDLLNPFYGLQAKSLKVTRKIYRRNTMRNENYPAKGILEEVALLWGRMPP